MRFTSALVLLTAPLLALSKIVISGTSYNGGVVHLSVSTYSDAPSSYNVVALDSKGNSYNIGSVNTDGSGNLDIALPANTPPGSYRVRITDPATGETLSTSRSFTVSSGDLAAASSAGLQSASYGYAVTGSIIPFVTTSLVTDASGATSVATVTISGPTPAGSAESVSSVSATSVLPATTLTVTSDSLATGSSGTSTVPVTQTITGLVSTGTNSNGAATATLLTATTTTRSAGFKNTAVGGGAFALVAAAFAGAAMFF
ncbi:hypothetical protein M407DRAFT_245111 [Tulasnella calospora MUT 4182]|uniref:Uncharacterized protein n=1 Tax=Tulasnella calospora MUT 4182 TaxID=1051891 RepID=A0A0C3QBV3_9AGAM|nr:hypothetical protein M407DRAFT_245355 [Tulasnella calospora MUT 4182]KIO22592.1 hypothetical protein M407DRAFT_245111 [Tulasnella calospora MUT 4182]